MNPIAYRRLQLRVSQRVLAQRVGVSTQTISKWERNGILPADPYARKRLAQALRLPEEKLRP